MASDPVEYDTRLNRLDKARDALNRKVEQGGRSGRPEPSSYSTGSGGKVASGKSSGSGSGARSAKTNDGNTSGPFRPDARALGNSGTHDGGVGKTSGKSDGSGRGVQAFGRQITRPKTVDDAFGVIRRILIYAGFDLKGDARALNEQEVEKYRPDVVRFIQTVGTVLDYTITHTNKDHMECDIWMFDDEEADTLATYYLKRARKVGWMAEVARQARHIEEVGETGRVAKIVGERLVATGMFYPSNGGFQPWLK